MEVALIFCLLLSCVFIVAITWLGERVRDAEAKLHEHFAEIDLLKAKHRALETLLSNLWDDFTDLERDYKIWQKYGNTPNVQTRPYDPLNPSQIFYGLDGKGETNETNNRQP